MVELVLDFVDSFFLVRNYFQGAAEVARANQTHHLHRSFLLFSLDELGIVAFNLGQIISRDGNEVNCELDWFV